MERRKPIASNRAPGVRPHRRAFGCLDYLGGQHRRRITCWNTTRETATLRRKEVFDAVNKKLLYGLHAGLLLATVKELGLDGSLHAAVDN